MFLFTAADIFRVAGVIAALLHVCVAAPGQSRHFLLPPWRSQQMPWTENIIGGTPANPEDFPSLVSLRVPENIRNPGEHFCGGVLIEPNVVLTAAHCLIENRLLVDPLVPLVDIGRYYRNGALGGEVMRFEAKAPRVHPDVKMLGGWFDNDIAVIELIGNATGIPVATLAADDCAEMLTCQKAVTAGWGLTDWKNVSSLSDLLLKVDIPVMDRPTCRTTLQADKSYITDNMICGGIEGRDTCTGDSGGPLFVGDKVLGIVSFGPNECGKPNTPGVCASVPAARAWIERQVMEIKGLIEPEKPPVPTPIPPAIGDQIVVSQWKPTYQSSTSRTGFSSLAVDGNPDPNARSGLSCTRTSRSFNPWWFVDLGMSRRVTRLRLTVESKGIGRSSRFALQNAEIHVGDERPSEKGLLNAACAEGLNLRSGQTKEFECNGNGRFVTIAVRGSAILSLCEVQVYAIDEPVESLRYEHSITFRAKGLLGVEKIAGVEVQTIDGRRETLSVGCLGTFSGQLTKEAQNCAAVLPLDINGTTVDTVTLLLANPFPTRESQPGIDFIDGQVWFMGNNIWRSAWNGVDISYPVDNLFSMRQGRILGSKAEMAIKRYHKGLWFEAKGSTGSETVSITALMVNGKIENMYVICGGRFEALEQDYTVCTSSTALGALDIKELHLTTGGEGSVEVNKARMFWYGTNMWWTGEFVTSPSAANAEEAPAEEKLSNGVVAAGKQVLFKVTHSDFSVEWRRVEEQGPDIH